jgi:hypothetical protein
MKIEGFKELLRKKAENNPNLEALINHIADDKLVTYVVESLEKMANINSRKSPNHALLHYGTHMDPEIDGGKIHDALSHHASHYKAALNSGKEKLADTHMLKIHKIMHMADKITKDGLNDHSNGKLKLDAPDVKPWERSKYSNKNPQGKFTTDTKGWGRQGSDYSYLRGNPHESYSKETNVHGHKGPYPLEQIKINGKYLDIDTSDIKDKNSHDPHIFDDHPIMSHYSRSPKDHSSDRHAEYLAAHDDYHADNGPMDKYFDRLESMDPEKLKSRGLKPSDTVHKPIDSSPEGVKSKLDEIKSKPQSAPVQSDADKLANIVSPPAKEASKPSTDMDRLDAILSGKSRIK